ncbi:class I SAM-dependent methyltransferase [Bradyrhizobium cenepequi]|uniref:class I SAM-dependent methyltransferase n=1 Tax=Bradyrhizobium cenepequi TaxID=2821403 RepID=UPI001CE2F64C|nr:class I SAM-dependent methyltransferase [Bradyrhizobium cenepequi]MCA6112860.1 class I SAM-dependent methyltransferase [Bradyrhizobium cenepequi]
MNIERHDVLFDASHPLPSNYRAHRHSVHARLLEILRQNPGCRFLEIGVGPTFRQERFRTIDDLGIHYVGLDFKHVCAERRADLAAAGIADRNIRFLGTHVGTYLFNLIRLARNRETFDIIYLDGNHSIYVDLAAAIAAVRLLKPGALFLFDDVRFAFGKRHLIQAVAQHADGDATEDLRGSGQRTSRHDHHPRLSDPLVQL